MIDPNIDRHHGSDGALSHQYPTHDALAHHAIDGLAEGPAAPNANGRSGPGKLEGSAPP